MCLGCEDIARQWISESLTGSMPDSLVNRALILLLFNVVCDFFQYQMTLSSASLSKFLFLRYKVYDLSWRYGTGAANRL